MKVRGRLRRSDVAYGLRVLSPRLVLEIARRGATVSAVVAASARRFGAAPAVVDERGALGYEELDALASAVASRIDHGGRLGIVCSSGRWVLVAIVAASRAGVDAVLISPGTGTAELEGIVERERITRILTDEDVATLASGPPALPSALVARRSPSARLVLLSSGTTGVPVSTPRPPLRRAQLATSLGLMAAAGIARGDAVLVLAPLHHGHGLSIAVACLAIGAPVLLGRDRLPRATVVTGVPAQLGWLAEQLESGTTVRRVISGSARLPTALAARISARSKLVNFFGTTQTGTLTVSRSPDSVGRPVAGVTIEIVDGAVLATSPLGSGPTGDRGHLDPVGNLVLTGRTDALVDSGGENISASEVEHVLLAQPDIHDARVRAIPDERLGHVLSARVVTGLSADDVRERVARELSRPKVPRDVQIVERIEG